MVVGLIIKSYIIEGTVFLGPSTDVFHHDREVFDEKLAFSGVES